MLENQFCSCFLSEFCPGVPWKGLQNIDPENDPNMTPGSVPSGPTINTNIQDVNRYLLRDRTGGEGWLMAYDISYNRPTEFVTWNFDDIFTAKWTLNCLAY